MARYVTRRFRPGGRAGSRSRFFGAADFTSGQWDFETLSDSGAGTGSSPYVLAPQPQPQASAPVTYQASTQVSSGTSYWDAVVAGVNTAGRIWGPQPTYSTQPVIPAGSGVGGLGLGGQTGTILLLGGLGLLAVLALKEKKAA